MAVVVGVGVGVAVEIGVGITGGSKFTVCPRCLKKVFDSVLIKPENDEIEHKP